MGQYDFDLEIPNIDSFKDNFIEGQTQETPDFDKMTKNFNAVVSAYDKLAQLAQSCDIVREQAVENIHRQNETMNGLMREKIFNKKEDDKEDVEELAEQAKMDELNKFFGI